MRQLIGRRGSYPERLPDVTMSDASEKELTGDGSAVIFRQSKCDIDPGAVVSPEAERQVFNTEGERHAKYFIPRWYPDFTLVF